MPTVVPRRIEGVFFDREPLHQIASPGSHTAIPALQTAFRVSGDIRQHLLHFLEGVSCPRGAVCPLASPLGSPRSVHPVLAAPRLPWRRTRGVKLRRFCGQVHGDQDLLGDGFALDEGDQAQWSLACRADGLDAEDPA